jgi:prevent-host-death family protein
MSDPTADRKAKEGRTVVTASDLRENLFTLIDRAECDNEPIFVARRTGRPRVVIISAAEYDALTRPAAA